MSEATPSLYFYMAGDERRGPFSFDQLLQQPVHQQTPVWCKGMADWQPADRLPLLIGLIPPAPPSGMHGEGAAAFPAPLGRTLEPYAFALVVVNYGILTLVLVSLLAMAASEGSYGILYWGQAIVRAGLIFFAAAKARFRLPWLWAVGGLVPLVWLFVMLVLHSRLKKPLAAAGYRISFLGRATLPAEGRA